jgi:hypothetical protein
MCVGFILVGFILVEFVLLCVEKEKKGKNKTTIPI